MRSAGWVLLLVLVGCADDDPLLRARTVCTAYCDCSASPGAVDACIDDCVPDIPAVSDDCLQCVYANSQTCAALQSECTALCSSATP